MDAWSGLYEAPAAITADWGHHRIFAPAAYKVVRTRPLVPIVHTEVLRLAPLFPTCWSLIDNEPTLCVLRTLLEDGSGMPGGTKNAMSVLPLAFQTYPVMVPHRPGSEQHAIMVDRVIADEPTDIGAPLLMDDGRLAKAAAMRVGLALRAGRSLTVTREISCFLYEANLLEPWPLRFDLGDGANVDINHLLVIAHSRFDDPQIYSAMRKFGVDAALFLSASRLSLFRVSGLLAAAKARIAVRGRQPQRAVAA